MYTQCPECKKAHSITVDELRTSHGMMNCEACNTMYDALELLNEGELPNSDKAKENATVIDETNVSMINPPNLQSRYWGVAAGFLIITLIFQVYFFEGYHLTQNTTLRPWITKACTIIPDCQLPHYKNLTEISILNGAFEAQNNHYVFKTAFINQSRFAQTRPSIKLTLLDFTGQAFAKRVFYPEDYSELPLTLLKPNLADEITLSIATPPSKIGGYRFELI